MIVPNTSADTGFRVLEDLREPDDFEAGSISVAMPLSTVISISPDAGVWDNFALGSVVLWISISMSPLFRCGITQLNVNESKDGPCIGGCGSTLLEVADTSAASACSLSRDSISFEDGALSSKLFRVPLITSRGLMGPCKTLEAGLIGLEIFDCSSSSLFAAGFLVGPPNMPGTTKRALIGRGGVAFLCARFVWKFADEAMIFEGPPKTPFC